LNTESEANSKNSFINPSDPVSHVKQQKKEAEKKGKESKKGRQIAKASLLNGKVETLNP